MVITFLLILIVLNGMFSLAETAVVSSRKSRLKQAAQEGGKTAKTAYKLAKHPARFLATIQIGITVIGILSGAFAEATLAQDLQGWLREFPFVAPYAEPISLIILVAVITYLSLVVGELVPKRIALMYPEAIATAIALPMRGLTRMVSPLVKLLNLSTDLLLRMLSLRPPPESPVSIEELKVLIQEGTEAGIFDKAEQDLITNVFRLAERRASALMTPRKEIIWLDTAESDEEVRAKLIAHSHAFFPVAQGNLDNVVGILSAKDILGKVLAGEIIDVDQMMHKPLIVPESLSTLQMLDSFRQSTAQFALIADEYGSILGAVTQNDVLESIVGDLPSPEDVIGSEEPEMVQREDGSWLVNGSMPADEFREALKLEPLPGQSHYDTVAGFVMMQLQKIPAVADSFVWNDTRFEVMDMDGKRIDKVLVVARAAEEKP
jgi:putative hemolysin